MTEMRWRGRAVGEGRRGWRGLVVISMQAGNDTSGGASKGASKGVLMHICRRLFWNKE